MQDIERVIEQAFEQRAQLSPRQVPDEVRHAVDACLALLDRGELRVAEPKNDAWVVNEWAKKAVLLSFRITDNEPLDGGFTRFFDKVPLKYARAGRHDLAASGVRIVPPATVRRGSYVAPNVVLMPSFVNIGAYVDRGTMIDTWCTVGSCAQVGKNVHLSGGVGLGGVLEPLQASPTIIEDNCFIGARSEVVEGVIVRAGAVLSMGVFISRSTKIYHRETGAISYGEVPPGAVVVPGNLPSEDGTHSLYCAVIVKQVDAKTRAKVGINELLRGT
jgi:2,3,4,5-tetrahydropyridine-2-carboxylate N-succinyltransferase